MQQSTNINNDLKLMKKQNTKMENKTKWHNQEMALQKFLMLFLSCSSTGPNAGQMGPVANLFALRSIAHGYFD